ncbi:MAG: SufS family cysteine desulfurase [Clostridium sp.]|nr:SufS family cysteine desulfurase [Bacteroides sp.]MCM1198924.1 SufS family cysteine desulfurase [Clostridium sp.]
MLVDDIRKQFPALDRKVYGKNLVYFDNAATIQRPQSVIDKWNEITALSNANIHRAVHRMADEATQAYEASRETVKEFIGAETREEIVFTSGATAAINLVAFSFGEAFVKEGDEVVVTEAEHHSNIVPWQMMCQRKGAVLKVLHVDDNGCLRLDELDGLLTSRTKILAVAHISNVLGIVNPVKEIVRRCHERGVKVLVDGAQGIVHSKVDVKEIGCDFYAFSGHKIYAATGTGVLYGKKELLDAMPPYMGGGEMVGTVRFSGTTYAPLPLKFEAGTQNFAGAATLKPALEFALSLRDDELMAQEDEMKSYLMDRLLSDGRIRLFGVPERYADKIPLFSFCVDGVHHEDMALILDKMGIAVRSGQMCAEPLMDRFGVTGMLRVSLAPYNTMEEAEYFVRSLGKAIAMLM